MKQFIFWLTLGFSLFLGRIALAEPLNIVTEHLAPFQIVDKASIGGLSTEIVKATLEAASIDYQIDVHPWEIAYKRVLKEKNTCIYSLARLPFRESQFQWIGHIADASSSFYALSKKGIVIKDIEDAKNYKTAVVRSDVTHHFLLEKGFVENQNMYASTNYDSLLQLLEVPSRDIDLVIIDNSLIKQNLKGNAQMSKYTNLFEIKELSLRFHLACSLATQQTFIDRLRTAMTSLEENETFDKIRAKWLTQ